MAPLEPAVKRAGSTSTFFAHSTFGRRLGGAASGMVNRERLKKAPVPRQQVDKRFRFWLSLPNSVGSVGRLVSEM